MADQKLSPQGSPAKSEIPAKAVPGKRAVIYTRVSTGDQHAETQLYDLRELAKQRRYEIVHEYTDTISGAKSKRPGCPCLSFSAWRPTFGDNHPEPMFAPGSRSVGTPQGRFPRFPQGM
jgi:hypothetical protein